MAFPLMLCSTLALNQLNGVPTHAVVDTGAQTIVISEESLGDRPQQPARDLPFKCRSRRWHGGEMRADVTFKIASKSINWDAYVAPIRDTVLLGYDLMKAHGVAVHTRVFFW